MKNGLSGKFFTVVAIMSAVMLPQVALADGQNCDSNPAACIDENPCDPVSSAYDPSVCDACDPSSPDYDEFLCGGPDPDPDPNCDGREASSIRAAADVTISNTKQRKKITEIQKLKREVLRMKISARVARVIGEAAPTNDKGIAGQRDAKVIGEELHNAIRASAGVCVDSNIFREACLAGARAIRSLMYTVCFNQLIADKANPFVSVEEGLAKFEACMANADAVYEQRVAECWATY
jgi:hypothetical protein